MNKLLHVTTYGRADCDMLLARLKFQAKLCGKLDRKLVLISSADVMEAKIGPITAAAKECYAEVETAKILAVALRQDWPYGVNHAFQHTVNILMGAARQKPNVSGYKAFLYYECDMTPLTPDFADVLDQHYFAGKRPFAGYIHYTIMRPTGRKVTHMNGGGCYPLDQRIYIPKVMLAERIPWDVNGLCDDKLGQITDLAPVYAHYYGTTKYTSKEGKITAIRGSKEPAEIDIELAGKVIHHGCKDQSIFDILIPAEGHGAQGDPATGCGEGCSFFSPNGIPLKSSQPESPSWQEQARADKANGMKWKDLLKKYGKMPAQMKKALEG